MTILPASRPIEFTMLKNRVGRNFLICFLLLNIAAAAYLTFAVLKRPDLLSHLPGDFGPSLSRNLSGNMLYLALLLLANAILFTTFGSFGVGGALWWGMRANPRLLRWFLYSKAGLSEEIAGLVALSVQEEEKIEIVALQHLRWLLALGLVLLALSLPAVSIAYTHAAPSARPLFESAGQTIANGAMRQQDILQFTTDQLAGAFLLDIPEIFHLRATPIESASSFFDVLIVLYRASLGFGLLLLFVGMRRLESLRDYAMEIAMPVREIVAMAPQFEAHSAPAPPMDESEHDISLSEAPTVEEPPVPEAPEQTAPLPIHATDGAEEHAP